MSAREWCERLTLGESELTRALRLLCVPWKDKPRQYASTAAGQGKVRKSAASLGLGLMDSWLTNRSAVNASAVMHYRVNFERLRAWWALNGVGQQFAQIEETGLPEFEKPASSKQGNQFPQNGETSGDIFHQTSSNRSDDDDALGARRVAICKVLGEWGVDVAAWEMVTGAVIGREDAVEVVRGELERVSARWGVQVAAVARGEYRETIIKRPVGLAVANIMAIGAAGGA